MTDDDRLILKEFIEQLVAALNKQSPSSEEKKPDSDQGGADEYDTPPQISGGGSEARKTMSEALVLVRNISQAGGALPPIMQKMVWHFSSLVDGGDALKKSIHSLLGVTSSFGKALYHSVRDIPDGAKTLIRSSIAKSLRSRSKKMDADELALEQANSIYRQNVKEKGAKAALGMAKAAYEKEAETHGVLKADQDRVTGSKAFAKAMQIGTGNVGKAARLGSGLVSAGAKGLAKAAWGGIWSGPGLMIASMAAQDAFEWWQKHQDAAMKSAIANQTHLNKLMLTGLQQESQMRQSVFRAEEEMDRKRFENLRALAEAKTKMNEGDLAMQERIQQIEKQRLAAQKQGELAKQQAGQLKERAQQTFDYLKEEGRVQDTAKRRSGILSWSWGVLSGWTGGRLGGNIIEDERGRMLDSSIGKAVERHGFFGREKDRALQSIMATAAQARENAMQAVENDFKEHIARYEEFAATIAATQVASLAPELAAARKKLDEEEKKVVEFMQTHEQSIAADRIAQMSYAEAKSSGKLKQDSFTGEYTITDKEGAVKVIQNESDWARFQSENRSGDAATYERMSKANEESMKLQEKMVAYQQASVALVQEQVKRQQELLKALRDSVAKAYDSDITGFFGPGNRKTGAEFREVTQNRADEMRRDAVLASRRFAGNAQAAEDYKVNADIQIAGRRVLRKAESDRDRERLDLEKKYATDIYSLRMKNVADEHKLRMQNDTKIFKAYMDAIKMQRDAYYGMLDKQLSRDVTSITGYGRPQSDVAQELQLSRIAELFEQRKADFESNFNMQKTISDASFDEAVRRDESTFKTAQADERLSIEKQIIENKYQFEKDLAVKEHELRVALIKEEYNIKRGLDQLDKQSERNAITEMDRIAGESNKEDLNKLVDGIFKGKTYEDLTREERGELYESIAIMQQGRVEEAAQAAGKSASDYVDANGNMLTGEALRAAAKEDVLAAYEGLSDKEKEGAKGQRYQAIAEGLGNTIENQVLGSSEEQAVASEQQKEKLWGRLDKIDETFSNGMQALIEQQTANEVNIANQKSKLDTKQEIERSAREENVNRARAYRESAWDQMHQEGQRAMALQQRQEEESFKLGVRQFARRETAATNAFAEKLGATNGTGYSAAILKEQNEQQFNNILDDMEVRHADELATARANGASESDVAKIQARQQLEYKEAENQKKISDTMLQRRIGSETGSTSDVMSMWEQIQASAFGHIEDPQVAAIDSLREQQRTQGEAMLRASLDQMGRLDNEVAYSASIAYNTTALLAEARDAKHKPKEKKEKTVVKEDSGLAERRS